jgi:streptogramin lyase
MSLDARARRAAQAARTSVDRLPPPPAIGVLVTRRRRRATAANALALALLLAVVGVAWRALPTGGEPAAGPPVAPRPRPLGRVAATVHLGGQLGGVQAGADAVWVQRGGEAVRVDPRSHRVVARVPLGPPGSGLGAAGDGSLWLTHIAQETVTRVDPASGRTVATIRVPGAGDAPKSMAVAVGAGGVWVGYTYAGTTLTRIDPATNTVAATVKLPNPPVVIAAGDRAVMVAGWGGDAYQIDPATNRVVASFPSCAADNDVAYGAGAFWIGCGEGRLLRVDPVAHRVTAALELGAAIGSAGEVAADGRTVWVAGLGDTLLRVDPQTNTIVGSLPVTGPGGDYLTGLAVGPGAVWLTTSGGTLICFDPNG